MKNKKLKQLCVETFKKTADVTCGKSVMFMLYEIPLPKVLKEHIRDNNK